MTVLGALILGLCCWPFVEYAVHGWLSHGRWFPWIVRMHFSHHADPRRVYTPATAWVPAALVLFGALVLPLGAANAVAFVTGLVLGFRRYESVHFAIHYRAPRNARELRRWQHHLAHHVCNSRAYFGVTHRFTDRLFGTLPANYRDDYARVSAR